MEGLEWWHLRFSWALRGFRAGGGIGDLADLWSGFGGWVEALEIQWSSERSQGWERRFSGTPGAVEALALEN